MNILVLAPHPDDEVLGVGGSIAKYAANGDQVYVAIITKGYPPLFDTTHVEKCYEESLIAHQILGVHESFFLSLPAASLDTVAHRKINEEIASVYRNVKPDLVFIPFNGDIHLDHQHIFLSALVAARPNHPDPPKAIYAYETLSETNWNAPYLTPGFSPNVFVDISPYLELKLEALRAYASQIKPFPHERSPEALRALAMLRGSTVHCPAAEAFVLIRQIVS